MKKKQSYMFSTTTIFPLNIFNLQLVVSAYAELTEMEGSLYISVFGDIHREMPF
jgi:hypothetical protein